MNMKRLEDKQKNVDARHALLALSDIEPNLGQLEGLPSNPRDITKEKVEMLKQSVLLNPQMLYLRGLMVYPLDNGRHVVCGGNMRYRALSEIAKLTPAKVNIALGFCSGYAQRTAEERTILREQWERWLSSPHKEVPCVIIPKETPIEQLKAYSIIDNSSFGKWDWDMLANEWDEAQLTSWGVDLPIFDGENGSKSDKDTSDGDGNSSSPTYEIIVECSSEIEQKKALEQLTSSGYKCRASSI